MARWKLTEPHYLKVPGTKWEYQEINRTSGKPMRVQFDVPTYLDPRDSGDWTEKRNNDDGDVVVSDGNNPGPRDVIFKGPPSPGMLPLDDEAKAITARFEGKWTPTASLDDADQNQSKANQLLENLIFKIGETQMGAQQVAAAPVKIEGLAELMQSMTAMMQQNQLLLEKVLAQPRRSIA